MTPLFSKCRSKFISFIAAVVAVVLFVLSVLRFFVTSYPIELLHHFQFQYFLLSIMSLLVLIAIKRWRMMIFACVVVIVSGSAVVPYWFGSPGVKAHAVTTQNSSTIRILHANVLSSNKQHAALLDLIALEKPDLVMLQEINNKWVNTLTPLESDYPFKCVAARPGNFGMAVYSRIPLLDPVIQELGNEGLPSIVFKIQVDDSLVDVIASHPMPPVSSAAQSSRNDQLLQIASFAAPVDSPLLIVGDLNTTMWTAPYQDLCSKLGLTNAREGFGVLPSWPAGMPYIMRIPIDHCLVNDEVIVSDCRLGSNINSDHLPLIVDIQIRN